MRDNRSDFLCPACGADSQFLADWEFSGLNDSVFDYRANFFECLDCGMSFIANISDQQLTAFYETECCYFDSAHFDISAPENIQKYQHYREILVRAGLSATTVTDVGCGRGGFLLWLNHNGWKGNCLGVDIDLKSIPTIPTDSMRQGPTISFQEGRAVSLPFADKTQPLLSYFHVLEHIRCLQEVLSEASRVLQDNGHIMIEVPDAERYQDYPIGTAFWLGIREHVNHFSPKALSDALQRNGFEVVSVDRTLLPTPEFSYPSLVLLARKSATGHRPEFWPNRKIASFILRSKEDLQVQADEVAKFGINLPSLTFWGCSAQLFSLLPSLSQLSFSLCDSSPLKQGCCYRGTPINNPQTARKDGALIIAPYLHGDAIEKAAIDLGWPENSIYRLR